MNALIAISEVYLCPRIQTSKFTYGVIFRLEKKHWSLIVIVLMISSGLAMFTYKSTDFVFVGFFMVLSASFLSGKYI